MNQLSIKKINLSGILVVGLLCGFAVQHVFALPTDKQQTLHIVADYVQIDHAKGTNYYKGNVHIEQGSTHLDTDILVTRNDQNNQLTEIIATGIGKRAVYRTLPESGKPEFIAQADIIKFYPQKNKVMLIGNARASQEKNAFTGPLIEYNTKLQTVVSTSSHLGRTTILIQPENPPSFVHHEDSKG